MPIYFQKKHSILLLTTVALSSFAALDAVTLQIGGSGGGGGGGGGTGVFSNSEDGGGGAAGGGQNSGGFGGNGSNPGSSSSGGGNGGQGESASTARGGGGGGGRGQATNGFNGGSGASGGVGGNGGASGGPVITNVLFSGGSGGKGGNGGLGSGNGAPGLNGSSGTMTVQNGGSVTIGSGELLMVGGSGGGGGAGGEDGNGGNGGNGANGVVEIQTGGAVTVQNLGNFLTGGRDGSNGVSSLGGSSGIGGSAGDGTVNITGGTLQFDAGSSGLNGNVNQGNGTMTLSSGLINVEGQFSNAAGSTIHVNGGTLAVGGTGQIFPQTGGVINLSGGTIHIQDNGWFFPGTAPALNWSSGTLKVDDQQVRVDSSGQGDFVSAGVATTLSETSTLSAGKVIDVSSEMLIVSGRTLTLSGADIDVTGRTTNEGTLDAGGAGSMQLGDASLFNGYVGSGSVKVQSGALLTLRSSGFVALDPSVQLLGGTLDAERAGSVEGGVFVAGGHGITGSGSVNTRVAADVGSFIQATGNLTLGAAELDGFFSDGTLEVGGNAVTLIDSNQALLGSLTTLTNGGSLTSDNGFILEVGKNIQSSGAVTINNVNGGVAPSENALFSFNHQGFIEHNSGTLTFTHFVQGGGDFGGTGTQNFAGGYSPGNSPDEILFSNMAFSAGNELLMEVEGAILGTEHDSLTGSGQVSLDGTLTVMLTSGFGGIGDVAAGDTFTLISTAPNGVSGTFANENLPTLGDPNLFLVVDYNPSSVVLRVAAVPEPSSALLTGGALAMLAARRSRGVL